METPQIQPSSEYLLGMQDINSGSGLESRIAALESIVNQTQQDHLQQVNSGSTGTIPHWRCVALSDATDYQATLGTASWVNSVLAQTGTSRIKFSIATAGGELDYDGPGAGYPTYHELTWDADNPYDATVWLSENGVALHGYAQVIFNGVSAVYYINTQVLTFNVKAGRNKLIIIKDTNLDGVVMSGLLFDGRSSRWVDSDTTETLP